MYLYRLHQISAFGLRTALSYVMDPILAHNLELILQICQGDVSPLIADCVRGGGCLLIADCVRGGGCLLIGRMCGMRYAM